VDLGFALPVSGAWATPDNMTAIARDADRHGFRGVWTFQRLLYDQRLAPVYHHVLDPLVALGYAAAVTDRVRLGLAVVNAPFYAPVTLAKQLMALDILSRGRLDAGLGLGWSDLEYTATGVPMTDRGRRFDEWLDCLDVLLTHEDVVFEGEFYTVPPSRIGPVLSRRPPVLIGGSAPRALRRAGSRGDGWISSSRASLEDIRAAVVAVRDAAEQAGKARDSVRCVVRGVTRLRDAAVDDADRAPLQGDLEQIRDDLARYAAADVDEVFLDLNFDSERVGNPAADPAQAMASAAQLMPLARETF
jgi:probable F420-dependent oxidoreductase